MSDAQYKPSTDRNEEYKEKYSQKLNDWRNHLAFRTMVYTALAMLFVLNIGVVNQLAKSGIGEWNTQELSFVFAVMGIFLIATFLSDLFRGVSYFTFSRTGKHRYYLVATVVLTVASGIVFTHPSNLPKTDVDAYVRFAWLAALVVGINYLPGGIFGRDVRRVREVIGI